MAKTHSPPPTAREIAEGKIAEIKALKAQKQDLEAKIKDLQAEVYGMADKNGEWFLKSNTASFSSGKLARIVETKATYDEDVFNISTFINAFPEAYKFELSTSKIKTLMEVETTREQLEKMGVRLSTTNKYEVK